jgi:hypothetical protein
MADKMVCLCLMSLLLTAIAPAQQRKDFDVHERFMDIYVKRKGRWQPVASHSTSLTKRNGS